MNITVHSGMDAFIKSKPSIQEGKINIQAYVPLSGERGSYFDEIWCKLKAREAIADTIGVSAQREPGACMALNQEAIDLALKSAPPDIRAQFEQTGISITCMPDAPFSRGDQWVPSAIRVEQTGPHAAVVQSPSLRTPAWVPRLGGNQYCKLLSPQGATGLIVSLAGPVSAAHGHGAQEADEKAHGHGQRYALTKEGSPYTIEQADTGMYTEGTRLSVTVGEDPVDIYLPNPENTPLMAAVFLQGAKCDKSYYSSFAKLAASYGFVIAVAGHKSLLGNNFTEQDVFNRVWDYMKLENRTPGSPLFRRLNVSRVALLGHSYGGVAALNCLQGSCSMPTCIGFSYEAPRELAAVVLYGTNTKSPMSKKFLEVNTRGIPVLYISGDRDGKALPADTLKTFRDKTRGGEKALATVRGANHYGITDLNNPPGGDSDPSNPQVDQKQAINSIARVSGIFLLAHMYDEPSARSYIYGGEGNNDPAITIQMK